MKNEYQPKTGERCGCRRGIERDNCAACEGTGQRIDFKAIRARPVAARSWFRCIVCPYATNEKIAFDEHTAGHRPASVDALELLRRGFECGIFDDSPIYKADVLKLLEEK
jgi:hypothetical protein